MPRSVTFCLYCGSRASRAVGNRTVTADSAIAASSRASGAPRPVIPSEHIGPQLIEFARPDRGSNVVDKPDDEPLVVNGAERRRQHFFGLEQVMDVGAGVVLACVAVTFVVDGREVAAVAGAGDIEAAGRRVHRGIASDARRRHT